MAPHDINQRMKHLKDSFLASGSQAKDYLARALLVIAVVTAMLMTTLLALRIGAPAADAYALRVSSSASCARLAGISPTVTNGPSWGRTILPGHGASGGWFGVDVCSNGINSVSPGGSNVSCSSVKHGCSPTNDGYGWTFQCPELIVRFSAWAFGDNPAAWGRSGWGNAPDLWLPVNHPSDFVMYPNGSSTPPVPGDILIWGYLDANGHPWPAGPHGSHGGHIAVVAAVRHGMVITAEQNVKWGSQDHPTDSLALTKVGSRWILSGSSQHTTTLPTWRWMRTMGHSRGTFGWLHSVKNTGHFPSKGAGATAGQKVTTSKQVSQQFPGGLPSLSTATVVTESGTLADLTWSTRSFYAPSTESSQPQAQVRSLGTPPDNVRLASGKPAATLLMSNGSRYSYALGNDGNLYAARTSPTSLGVFWSALGQPPNVSLTSAPVASLFAGGVQVAALGSDGNLWWRAGLPDRLGNWVSLGMPATTHLEGSLALAGVPGSGSPVAFALGVDGHIYLKIWQDAITAADGTELPAAWSDWMPFGTQGAERQITGSLLIVPELPDAHNWIGPWPDSPLNLFATDSNGAILWFRTTHLANGWTVTPVTGNSTPLSVLLGGISVTPPTDSDSSAAQANTIHLYAAGHAKSYLCVLTLPDSNHKAEKPTWTTLASQPAGVAASGSSAAVALGPGSSALVAAAGDDVVIGGAREITAAIIPAMAAQAAGSNPASNPWVDAGTAPATATFSDNFTSSRLDSRWTRSDASVRASFDAKGLVLVPGRYGVAALTQAASAGDGTLTVQIASPRALPDKGRVGLVLYLDDGDWLTLTVDRTGAVRLCPMVQQVAQPCATGTANARMAIWLRIQRSSATFVALFSSDGTQWEQMGQWTPVQGGSTLPGTTTGATPQVQPTATMTATPHPDTMPVIAAPGATDLAAAPLAFTSWGVLAVGDGNAPGWPRFTDFTVSPGA